MLQFTELEGESDHVWLSIYVKNSLFEFGSA